VLGHAVRSGHRGSHSTAFVLSKSVAFKSTLGRDFLALRALVAIWPPIGNLAMGQTGSDTAHDSSDGC